MFSRVPFQLARDPLLKWSLQSAKDNTGMTCPVMETVPNHLTAHVHSVCPGVALTS